jgi:gluconate 2-dehydrogenase gamma chain
VLHDPSSRRAFLAISGAALATLWLSADPEEVRASLEHAAHAASHPGKPLPLEVLTPEQAADIEAIAEQIFPRDDTPGARDARVVNFVDRSLATWAAQQREPMLKGLDELNVELNQRWPGTGRFAKLGPDRQLELLKAREKTPFFQQMRFATLVGMFSVPSYGGNADKAGWRQIGFDDRYTWQPPFGDYDAEVVKGEK